ncbi:hypothetical protein [Nocardia wallacei]|uniref:Uncharacterized protein n=1 Tax=Nocardia wallacei TaxID=480035 RepID=A0A7G1KSY7_9NOCA|nr:hypothetical protein [Nocardia wallacei]BCK58345.1 hypothetical protein NWFMUON74_61170 [Nocardia wallacei]
MTNPEDPVLAAIDALERDEIDDLVEQQLTKGIRSGEYRPHRPPRPVPAVVPPRPPIGLPPPRPVTPSEAATGLQAVARALAVALAPITRQLQAIAAAFRPRPAAPETADDTESDRQK